MMKINGKSIFKRSKNIFIKDVGYFSLFFCIYVAPKDRKIEYYLRTDNKLYNRTIPEKGYVNVAAVYDVSSKERNYTLARKSYTIDKYIVNNYSFAGHYFGLVQTMLAFNAARKDKWFSVKKKTLLKMEQFFEREKIEEALEAL